MMGLMCKKWKFAKKEDEDLMRHDMCWDRDMVFSPKSNQNNWEEVLQDLQQSQPFRNFVSCHSKLLSSIQCATHPKRMGNWSLIYIISEDEYIWFIFNSSEIQVGYFYPDHSRILDTLTSQICLLHKHVSEHELPRKQEMEICLIFDCGLVNDIVSIILLDYCGFLPSVDMEKIKIFLDD